MGEGRGQAWETLPVFWGLFDRLRREKGKNLLAKRGERKKKGGRGERREEGAQKHQRKGRGFRKGKGDSFSPHKKKRRVWQNTHNKRTGRSLTGVRAPYFTKKVRIISSEKRGTYQPNGWRTGNLEDPKSSYHIMEKKGKKCAEKAITQREEKSARQSSLPTSRGKTSRSGSWRGGET